MSDTILSPGPTARYAWNMPQADQNAARRIAAEPTAVD